MWTYQSPNELYHHGVKGMKWGVRRYQNKDGSLTPRGKKRYGSSDDVKSMSTDELRKKVNRMSNEQRYIELTKKSSSTVSNIADTVDNTSKSASEVVKAYNTANNGKDPKGNIASQTVNNLGRTARLAKKVDNIAYDAKHTKKTRAKLESMSDSDLVREVDRLNLEQQYSKLKSSTINSGKVKASDVISIAGDVAAIGASAVTIAVGIKKLMNK